MLTNISMVNLVVKKRRHHNNKGLRQIKEGKTVEQVKKMAKRLFKYIDKRYKKDDRGQKYG